ncbi:DUF4249 domain-containing protein [Maribacter sp. 2308TA10-17]|uniref:DUF4249 domain-containing protein n=1 Tax=Maribacter sp. 2308TA10-17 TaxID=3386276 RepID=UPI0039BCBE16
MLNITLLVTVTGCIEPFDFETRNAENVLVVEATITDKMETQQVFLKRASNLGEVNLLPVDYNPNISTIPIRDLTKYEENAKVSIIDNMGNEYDFTESDSGTYLSDLAFASQPGVAYKLQITTTSNEIVESDFQSVPGKSQINDLYAERTINDEGTEGMAVYLDGEDANGSTNYFRYVYEETYKIIAPRWTPREFHVIYEGNSDIGEIPIIELVPRAQEEKTCYGSANSSDILLANTLNLESPKIQRNLVRFIDRDNAILSHRYSILVKQFLQSQESYQYYERLKSFSNSESVFSEIQPGFLEGNLKSSMEGEPIIGYFDVASVSEDRIFFDYIDFFEGEDLPPYFFGFNCDRLLSPPLIRQLGCPEPLPVQIRWEIIEYWDTNDGTANIVAACPGPYIVTQRICGDCTVLGSNIKPDFWID